MFRDLRFKINQRKINKRNKKVIPTELWNLDITLAEFALPRLRQFRKETIDPHTVYGFPSNLTLEEWVVILNKIIFSFEMVANKFGDEPFDKVVYAKHELKYNEGMNLFKEYFRELWQ